MEPQDNLIAAAERLFDEHGYTATGMDRLTQAAGMSSRTLYKRVGSKVALMGRVLAARDRRFVDGMAVASVDALFSMLMEWVEREGARGCLFLRSLAETGGASPEIAEAVSAHKARFVARIRVIVAGDLGRDDAQLAEQILVLIEGAAHAAVYRGPGTIAAARAAAATLMDARR